MDNAQEPAPNGATRVCFECAHDLSDRFASGKAVATCPECGTVNHRPPPASKSAESNAAFERPPRARPNGSCDRCAYDIADRLASASSPILCPECGTLNRPPPEPRRAVPLTVARVIGPGMLSVAIGASLAIAAWFLATGDDTLSMIVLLAGVAMFPLGLAWSIPLVTWSARRRADELRAGIYRRFHASLSNRRSRSTGRLLGYLAIALTVFIVWVIWAALSQLPDVRS